MNTTISVNWVKGMAFESIINNHRITVDASTDHGGTDKGPGPKSLIAVGLGGCTGMDIVSLLEKMRVPFDGVSIVLENTIADEHPKKYEQIHIVYEIKGKNIDKEKVEKAVALSTEKYCGVYATLKAGVKLTHEIRIIE